MNSFDTIEYTKSGFDNVKYEVLQRNKILERVSNFSSGRLYLEIGGKLLNDPHGSRVLPGFKSTVKMDILRSISQYVQLIFCVNAKDIKGNRKLGTDEKGYVENTVEMLQQFHIDFGMKPVVSINLIDSSNIDHAKKYREQLQGLGYNSYFRYVIENYLDQNITLSKDGYGKDEYIPVNKNLVVITGAASNSGKLSTALGQIYHELQKGKNSGFAKYETFPIWSLPLNHPVNLAYEAATADIGDFNMIDQLHQSAYGTQSVNYNRDIEAFNILNGLIERVNDSNHMKKYRSPTDMGINLTDMAITDDQIVSIAGYREIVRRRDWYKRMVQRGDGIDMWVQRCENLIPRALEYINQKGYDINLVI